MSDFASKVDVDGGGSEFSLCCELTSHSSDVRSLGLNANGELLTGSRDCVLRRWTWAEGMNSFACSAENFDHAHWVTCITSIPPDAHPACPEGGIVTGCQDSLLRIFTPSGKMVGTMEGHKGPVSSIVWHEQAGQLISGSWDSTVRLWNVGSGVCAKTLTGFENAVVVAVLPNEDIVTGSSGKSVNGKHVEFTLRIFRAGAKVSELRDHSQRITGIAVLPGIGFATSSNDGTVRVRDAQGATVQVLGNEDYNFVMAVAYNEFTGEIVSVSDDGVLSVWKDGKCIQQIRHPSSIWDVMVLPNGDIVTAGTDKTARVFTRDGSRTARDELIQDFLGKVEEAQMKLARANSKQIDPATLIPYTLDVSTSHPGKKDGDVRMFNKGGKPFSYRWDGSSKTWTEVGEVMGGAGELVEGVLYDKVLPIEIEDVVGGTGIRSLKIGFNNGDNPYVVAQKFCEKHRLEMDYTGQVAEYIQKNRGSCPPTIDMASNASGNMTVAQLAAMQGGTDTPMFDMATMSSENGRAAASASSGSKVAETVPKFTQFPPSVFTAFRSANNLEKIAQKILEFNEDDRNRCPLSLSEKQTFSGFITTLLDKSRYHSSKISAGQMQMLVKMFKWPAELLFPVLDLARVAVLHSDTADTIANMLINGDCELVSPVVRVLQESHPVPIPLAYLSMRYLTNLISDSRTRKGLRSYWHQLLSCTCLFVSHGHKHVRTGTVSLLLGVAQMFAEAGNAAPDEGVIECMKQLIEMLSHAGLEETTRSSVGTAAMIALGTLLCSKKSTYVEAALSHGLPEAIVFARTYLLNAEVLLGEVSQCLA